jgi:hypothetical protein
VSPFPLEPACQSLNNLPAETPVLWFYHHRTTGLAPTHAEALSFATVDKLPMHGNLAFWHRERCMFAGGITAITFLMR